MNDFVIVTDSACDICKEKLSQWGAECIYLSFCFDGGEEYFENEVRVIDFYNKMRQGYGAQTSAINPDTFYSFFKEILLQGKDVLYLGFSSGLSATNNSANVAAEQLKNEFLKQKIIVVDTLAVSAGLGLIVYLATVKKQQGATIQEVAKYVESIKTQVNHWATVEDLKYLYRGGRISTASAIVGTTLNIKPIICTNSQGKLVSYAKERGRNASIKALAEKYFACAENYDDEVFISHADAFDAAITLADIVSKKRNKSIELITDIGAVVGAHAGPGACAIFFLGKENKQ